MSGNLEMEMMNTISLDEAYDQLDESNHEVNLEEIFSEVTYTTSSALPF